MRLQERQIFDETILKLFSQLVSHEILQLMKLWFFLEEEEEKTGRDKENSRQQPNLRMSQEVSNARLID